MFGFTSLYEQFWCFYVDQQEEVQHASLPTVKLISQISTEIKQNSPQEKYLLGLRKFATFENFFLKQFPKI